MAELDLLVEDSRWQDYATPAPDSPLRVAADAALAGAGYENVDTVEISILLADDARVAALNETYRGKTGPTNILSFPGLPVPVAQEGMDSVPLGDLALAYQTIAREAQAGGKPFLHHLQHLIVHGVLHLLGYDHEIEADAETMESLETEILAGLGISDPYTDPPAEATLGV